MVKGWLLCPQGRVEEKDVYSCYFYFCLSSQLVEKKGKEEIKAA